VTQNCINNEIVVYVQFNVFWNNEWIISCIECLLTITLWSPPPSPSLRNESLYTREISRFRFWLVRDPTLLRRKSTHIADCTLILYLPCGWRSRSRVLIRSLINYLSAWCLSVYTYNIYRRDDVYEGWEAHAPISWILSDHHLHNQCRCHYANAARGVRRRFIKIPNFRSPLPLPSRSSYII